MDHNLEKLIRERAYEIWTAWLRTRSSRSALAGRRAGNLDGIDGHAPRQARPTKAAPVACTFKDHQDPRAGQLMPQMPPRVTKHRWHRSLNEEAPFHRTKEATFGMIQRA
jgi:hypothetical protein